MRSIYIQNSAGIAASDGAANDPEDVADGKVVLLGIDGEGIVSLDSTDDHAPDRFQIVQGTPDGGEPAPRSGIINYDDIKDVIFQAYSAPQPQVTTVTPTAGSAAAGSAGLRITRIDGGVEKFPRQNYEIEVDAADTVQDVCDKLRTAITEAKSKASTINQPLAHIINASGTTTLILTAITPELHKTGTYNADFISFETGLFGDAVDGWTIASTTAPQPGTGSYNQVAEYENRAQGNRGFKYTEYYPQRPEHYADEDTTYDLVTLLVKTNAEKSINKSFQYHEHVIAVAAGELTEANVLGVLKRTNTLA